MAGKLLKFLPKPTSFSINPNGSNTSNKPSAAGFSGPIVSIVPKEARRTKKKAAADAGGEFEDREPTSPKVSCIGQVKNGDKKKQQLQQQKKHQSFNERKAEEPKKKVKKHQSFDERRLTEKKGPSGIKGMFRRKGRSGRPPPPPEQAAETPKVGRMRRYASGRETLRDFDWRAAAAAAVGPGEEEEEEEKVVISHSGPILMGGGAVAVEKKKEVNLWKRRTLTAPVALQV